MALTLTWCLSSLEQFPPPLFTEPASRARPVSPRLHCRLSCPLTEGGCEQSGQQVLPPLLTFCRQEDHGACLLLGAFIKHKLLVFFLMWSLYVGGEDGVESRKTKLRTSVLKCTQGAVTQHVGQSLILYFWLMSDAAAVYRLCDMGWTSRVSFYPWKDCSRILVTVSGRVARK